MMIYYVEDDTNIRELTLYALRQSGLQAQGFPEAAPFRKACLQQVPDLILLDIMLPGEDGLSVLSWVRSTDGLSRVPVMMLTAKGAEYDKVRGLDMGADDYLAKPFGMMELVSRCKALLRRSAVLNVEPEMPEPSSASGQGAIELGVIELFPREHEVRAGGVAVVLTLKEYELLRKFMENPGQAFSRPQLLEDIWNISFVGETRTVDTHIQTLRSKLNAASQGAGDVIQTVRGVGYRIAKDS